MIFELTNLKQFIQDNKDSIVVIADKHTFNDCYPLLEADLPHFIVPYGEGYKNLRSCEFIWKKLTDLNVSRDQTVLCLGGGVLSDLVAFACCCYRRGIPYVLAPTSLLAMVDASIGGKNGINFLGIKNYIGNINQSQEVFICPEFLPSLPEKELKNGFVEMLKHGLIADQKHYNDVKLHLLKPQATVPLALIKDSIAIKQNLVDQDVNDMGVRRRLNFGHTIGHAIESWSLYVSKENKEWSHGVCVALGMIAEAYISTKELDFDRQALNELTIVLQSVLTDLDRDLPSYKTLHPFLLNDKKNSDGNINFTLLRSVGDSIENKTTDKDTILHALTYLEEIQ